MGFGSILWQVLDFPAKQWIKDTIKCCHWARTTNIGLLYPDVGKILVGIFPLTSPPTTILEGMCPRHPRRRWRQCRTWKLYRHVHRRSLPIHLFSHICRRMYRLATMHSVTDKRHYDAKSRPYCVRHPTPANFPPLKPLTVVSSQYYRLKSNKGNKTITKLTEREREREINVLCYSVVTGMSRADNRQPTRYSHCR